MRKIAFSVGASLLLPFMTNAANVTVPQSTAYGQVLIGNSIGGNYTPVATSSLGITGGASASFSYPFTPTENYGVTNSATSTPIFDTLGLNASSTSHFVNASTTLVSSSASAYLASSAGTVMIGNNGGLSTTADNTLEVGGVAINSLLYPFKIQNTGGNDDSSVGMLFDSDGGTIGRAKGAIIYLSNGSGFGRGTLCLANNSAANTSLPALSDCYLNVSNSGKIGIGTTTPYAALSVVGQAVAAYFTATTSTASIFPYASTTVASATSFYASTGTSVPNGFVFSGNSNPFIDSDANQQMSLWNSINQQVGITINTAEVQFRGSPLVDGAGSYTTNGSMPGTASSPAFSVATHSDGMYDDGGAGHLAFTNGTSNVAEFSGTNMGIGTTTPYAKLSIQSGSSSGDAFSIATSSGKSVRGEDNSGHAWTSGPAPAISTCGTGTGTVAGDDQSGVITTATAATACTMTFAAAYAATPSCTVSDNSLVGFPDISSISTTAVTFGISSALTGGNLYYQCGYHK